MADASYAQDSFLGGEISEWAQGRFTMPRYKIALAKALNLIIVDEGAATRRPGTQFLGTTRNGAPGRVITFEFTEDTPYLLEFTDGYLRFWNGEFLVTTNDSQDIASVSGNTAAIFRLASAVTWNSGDQVFFTFDSPFAAVIGQALLNRQFTLTMLTPTTFTLTDTITGVEVLTSMLMTNSVGIFLGPLGNGPVSGNSISGSVSGSTTNVTLSATVNHIAQVMTPYTVAGNDWHLIRAVQGLNLMMLLQTGVSPQALQVLTSPSDGQFATFEYSTAFFQDGPYLDPPANSVAYTQGTSGSIQVAVSYPGWVNGVYYGLQVPVTYNGQDYISVITNNVGNIPGSSPAWQALPLGSSVGPKGFVQTDVGRMMRLFSAPSQWSPGTTYSAGQSVTYNGEYFTSLINSNTNNEPDISLSDWVINPSGAIYTWGIITAILNPNTVQLQLYGSALLYTVPCPAWQLGAWSDTTGWPTCGAYYQGRFWFGGAIPNRVDSSQPNSPFIMAPTEQDGTVTDSSAISYTFNSNSNDKIEWMEPLSTGLMIGTKKGEYLLNTGTSTGPITPTNITDSPATKYGSANIQPVKTGLTMCFVQRYQRRLLEYLADVFSLRFYGPELTTFARHLGQREFQELAYQQEPVPVVWARMGDGSLIGTTYRRVSLFSNQEPEFNAWHQHAFGSGRLVESIAVGPSMDGVLDTLSLVSNDPTTNIRFVTSISPMLDETDPLTSAWFLDTAVTPQAAVLSNCAVTFYGLNYLNGTMATVFAAAIDCGDYLVENGQITVPLGTLDAVSGYTFDMPQFNLLQPLVDTFSDLAVMVVNGGTTFSIPCVIGYNYQTQGQLCRPMLPVDTGAKNGPGFGKKRRSARYAINMVASLGLMIGTSFAKLKPVPVNSPTNNSLLYLSTYTGIRRETLSDDFSFDSMLCWQTTRPYPATVVTLGAFTETQDV